MKREGIRIGLIGCGRIARAHLAGIRTIVENGLADVRVTALCARNVEKALRYVKRSRDAPQRPQDRGNLAGPAPKPVYISEFQPDDPPEKGEEPPQDSAGTAPDAGE